MVDPTVTKEDVDAFTDDCLRLRAIWHHYQILFEYSQLRRELLDSVAGTFFRDINLILIGQMILQICRITDPIQMRGRTNLTVKTLIAHSDFSSEPGRLEKLEWLSERMHDFRKLIEPARNRFISHLDLESVRIGEPLGDAPRERWLDFWIDLQEFLHIMYKHHVDPNGQFYLNAVGMMSDADQLVKALRESKYFWALLEDRATTRLASDAANKSKYHEA
jgi:hypothetical protein